MQAFENFKNMPSEFWAFIKFIGDNLKYTSRKSKKHPIPLVKSYSISDLQHLADVHHIFLPPEFISAAAAYLQQRADILNQFVRLSLMDASQAQSAYENFLIEHSDMYFLSKIPHNLQSGQKKQIAYFTALINLITEFYLKSNFSISGLGFDCDPHSLLCLIDNQGQQLLGSASRRFDGAFPSTTNPKIVWEIKEYYYTTSFGSRVADGVYETELDGFELREIYERTGIKVYHVLFIDAYDTWWLKGRSYLCRISR